MNAYARRISAPRLGARPARWRAGTDGERIDVRRGDLPYDRVVDPSPGLPSLVFTQAAPSANEPVRGPR